MIKFKSVEDIELEALEQPEKYLLRYER